MTVGGSPIPVTLGFVPGSVAVPDVERPGLLRAGPRAAAPYAREHVEQHVVPAIDISQDGATPPDLLTFGFDTLDLSPLDALQAVCARVRDAGVVSDDDAATIRASLAGATLRSLGGRTVTVLHLADEGFIMRQAGPNGMAVVGPRSNGMNGHGSATSVHADQDVFGTPVAQLLDGRAPSMFRHDSPDGANRDAGLMLVNLWIPLQQISQPLALADGRSIDRRSHQLRYGLATGTFLEREDELAVNDIWTFLHHRDQRWYVRSDMDHRSAYVFDTLSTAHGACTLPGEEVAEQLYRLLEDAEAAVDAGDVAALVEAVSVPRPAPLPDGSPPVLRDATGALSAVVDEARADPVRTCGDGAAAWLTRSRRERQRLVRRSLEMRLVVSIDE